MTVGLSAITSNYGHLNGVENAYYNYGCGYGYGGCYSGVCNTASAEHVKDRITNNYDITATQQGLRSKQGVETLNNAQQCTLISEDLKRGEIDQASERFQEALNAMKNLPQYANYSDTELCSLLRDQYATSTGSDMVVDINRYGSDSFWQGFKRGVPLLGLLANRNSSADLVSQVTNNEKSKGEKSAKIIGTSLGAATGVAAATTAYKTGALGWIKDNVLDKLFDTSKKLGKVAKPVAIAAGVAAAVGLAISITQNVGSRKKD